MSTEERLKRLEILMRLLLVRLGFDDDHAFNEAERLIYIETEPAPERMPCTR